MDGLAAMADEVPPGSSGEIARRCGKVAEAVGSEREDSGDETTPTTRTESECSEPPREEDWDSEASAADAGAQAPQLGPGLFPDAPAPEAVAPIRREAEVSAAPGAGEGGEFTREETLFVFDWDDTILPSTWIQREGLRLDGASTVSEWQREQLSEVAAAAAETLRLAKLHGTVVLLTNAERGWIELSCQKFVPELLPIIENIKIVSARTSYESPTCPSPVEWKVHAFAAEIARACGADVLADPARRKNIHSLGDSTSEREALLRATSSVPNCRSKCVKFVDHPDISQLLKQHALVTRCFEQISQHDDHLDLCIDCS